MPRFSSDPTNVFAGLIFGWLGIALLGLIGWIANIVQLVMHMNDPLTTMMIRQDGRHPGCAAGRHSWLRWDVLMFHVNPTIATPRQIDWLVAQIEGYTGHLKASGSIIYTKDDGSWVDDVNWAVTSRPFYSMPIIEREKIAIIPATYGPDSIIH